jgi:adenosylcobinamide-phosphate synthase
MHDSLVSVLDGSVAMPLAALAAVVLDTLLGEPSRLHPLVGFGRLASAIERYLNRKSVATGCVGWALAVLPWVAAAALVRPLAPFAVDVALLYFALGARSLGEHAAAVAVPLSAGRLDEARERVGRMVSRDTGQLDAAGVAGAGVESVLENGNDAIFAALFWFALLGGPGALLFRLANTLDAMWGYRSERYNLYGRFAACFDDVLNWLPARLTALTYALLGRTGNALHCWRAQAPGWESPNAGPVMAAGAGSLGVQLGGAAVYKGRVEPRPPLGNGPAAAAGDIGRAVALVRRSLVLWLIAFLIAGWLYA